MFCPVCKDEFRPGFIRCRACDVDLVGSLDEGTFEPAAEPVAEAAAALVRESRPAGRGGAPGAHEPTVNFCGFLTIEDARHAKSQLGAAGISAEILIRDSAAGHEEFWLRVRPTDFRATQDLLGYDDSSLHDEDAVFCSACETLVPGDGEICPNCGARFEEA